MRILFVVQRYGADVAGGAEQHCRQFATRLAAAGHRIEVLSSRAVDSRSWANEYPSGTGEEDGVTVHRLATSKDRDEDYFDALSWRVLYGGRPAAPVLEEAWVRAQGPLLPDLIPWLRQRVTAFDVAVFFTYLFHPSWAGLPAVAGLVPTVLHATAHDEPAFWLRTYDLELRLADGYAWSTEEERRLLARRGLGAHPGEIVGIGIEPLAAPAEGGSRFRSSVGLGDRPYLLTLGRVAEGKGSGDLVEWFREYKARRPGPLALVLAGQAEMTIDSHPDVVVTGYLPDRLRDDALAGCVALAQPSYFESFSMVLSEAWAAGKPALVQGRSEVLAGQTERSGGGLCFTGFAEFGAAVDLILDHPDLARRLGRAGRSYVLANSSWDAVLDRYQGLLERVGSTFGQPVND